MPSDWAVLRLIISSYFVGCWVWCPRVFLRAGTLNIRGGAWPEYFCAIRPVGSQTSTQHKCTFGKDCQHTAPRYKGYDLVAQRIRRNIGQAKKECRCWAHLAVNRRRVGYRKGHE